jgi:hypothetical protein
MTLFGWDASDFDWSRGPMDLAAAKRDGISVFTHKATEGTSTKHKHYGEAMNRARAAGIPYLGAYLVARTGNAAAEVDYFLSYVNAQTPWWSSFPGWFWQIDLELWPYDRVSAGTGESVADELARRTGKPTIIYASRGQYGNGLAGTDHQLWNAAYGSNPAKHYREAYPGDSGSGWTGYSGRTPLLWQYGSKTTIGRQPTCDANAVRDASAWQALFGEDMTPDQAAKLDFVYNMLNSLAWGKPEIDGVPDANGKPRPNCPVQWEVAREAREAEVSAGLAAIAAKPAVDPTAVTAAVQAAAGPAIQAAVQPAVVAALTDPATLAAIAKAVNDDEAQRMAQ